MVKSSKPSWPADWFDDDEVVSFSPSVASRLGRWWLENVFASSGISPRDFGRRLVAGLNLDDKVEFLSFDRRYRRVSILLSGIDGNTLVYMAGHTFVLSEMNRKVDVDLLGVEEPYQGLGIGTTLMSNLFELGETVGVTKIGLKAGLHIGPYVCVKFGIFPTDSEWEKVKAPIAAKLQALGRMVPDDVRLRVEGALAADDGAAIAVIAAEEVEVMSRSEFGGPPRDVPLGRALLADTKIRWYGELDFADDVAMSIFRERIAGAKTRRSP